MSYICTSKEVSIVPVSCHCQVVPGAGRQLSGCDVLWTIGKCCWCEERRAQAPIRGIKITSITIVLKTIMPAVHRFCPLFSILLLFTSNDPLSNFPSFYLSVACPSFPGRTGIPLARAGNGWRKYPRKVPRHPASRCASRSHLPLLLPNPPCAHLRWSRTSRSDCVRQH